MGYWEKLFNFNKPSPKSAKLIFHNRSNSNSLHAAVRLPMRIAQFFGYFPINGLGGSTYKSLRYKWVSWKMAYTALSTVFFIANFVMACGKFATIHVNVLELNAVVFHLESIIAQVLFCKLAQIWPSFVKQWHEIEIAMKSYERPENLKVKIKWITVAFLTFALTEHLLIFTYKLKKSLDENPNLYEGIRAFFVYAWCSEVFMFMEYSIWKGLVLQFMNMQRTFIWTFLDIFLMTIAVAFTFRIRQITTKLHYLSRVQIADYNVWKTIREDYIKLSQLCDSINKNISYFVLLSYSANLYFFLVQMFGSLTPMDVFQKLYFYCSFSLILVRLLCVCVYGGMVHDENGEIVRVLTSVPSIVYNEEVERFITHMTTCEVVLTGKNFFKITRNLVLKIASAIVTYELVLIQFMQQDLKKGIH